MVAPPRKWGRTISSSVRRQANSANNQPTSSCLRGAVVGGNRKLRKGSWDRKCPKALAAISWAGVATTLHGLGLGHRCRVPEESRKITIKARARPKHGLLFDEDNKQEETENPSPLLTAEQAKNHDQLGISKKATMRADRKTVLELA